MFNKIISSVDEELINFVPIFSLAWRAAFPGLEKHDISIVFITVPSALYSAFYDAKDSSSSSSSASLAAPSLDVRDQ